MAILVSCNLAWSEPMDAVAMQIAVEAARRRMPPPLCMIQNARFLLGAARHIMQALCENEPWYKHF